MIFLLVCASNLITTVIKITKVKEITNVYILVTTAKALQVKWSTKT